MYMGDALALQRVRARASVKRRVRRSVRRSWHRLFVMAVLFSLIGLAVLLVAAALLARQHRASEARAHARHELESLQMRDQLKSLSLELLQQTGESVAQRITDARRAEEERATGEMARRTEEIKGLVQPVQERLGRMEGEIGRLERERRQAQGELAQMVRQLHEGVGTLRQETGNLVSALKRPTTRGSWGEIQLRNVIEMAGMVAHCDFEEQSTIHTEDGRLRPDVLVRLPGDKLIVVDSKVPLDAYLASVETDDEGERERALARHARQTRDHVTKLASKGYQRQFDTTPELVVMFVPSDGIYQAALAEDPSLIEYGVQQHVLMATPTTLIGLLRAVHYGWRQELIAESAREIAESARELHGRMGRFVEPFAQIGRRLESTVSSYNEAVGSFDRRVVPQLRRIEQAGAASDREIATPDAVQAGVRPLTAQLASESDGAPPEPLTEALEPPSAPLTLGAQADSPGRRGPDPGAAPTEQAA